jgi:hypothetical protein
MLAKRIPTPQKWKPLLQAMASIKTIYSALLLNTKESRPII